MVSIDSKANNACYLSHFLCRKNIEKTLLPFSSNTTAHGPVNKCRRGMHRPVVVCDVSGRCRIVFKSRLQRCLLSSTRWSLVQLCECRPAVKLIIGYRTYEMCRPIRQCKFPKALNINCDNSYSFYLSFLIFAVPSYR